MRENIGLYRGKLKDNDEWVYWNIYGELTAENGKRKKYTITKGAKTRCYYYIYQLKQAIIPETVGEYTDFTDKNNKMIFEGDIVREYGGEFAQGFYEIDRNLIVEIPNTLANFILGSDCGCKYEIIGSIHDNSELLKGGNALE